MVGDSWSMVVGPFESPVVVGVDDRNGKDILGPAIEVIGDGFESPTEEDGKCKLTTL
jgi:hypothetical protein